METETETEAAEETRGRTRGLMNIQRLVHIAVNGRGGGGGGGGGNGTGGGVKCDRSPPTSLPTLPFPFNLLLRTIAAAATAFLLPVI